MLEDEVVPRRVAAERAGTGEREIGNVQTGEVSIEIAPGWRSVRKRVPDTRFEDLTQLVAG